MNRSNFLRIGLRDITHTIALIVLYTFITGILPYINEWTSSETWSVHIAWMPIIKQCVKLAIAYLVKQFFSNSQGELFTKEKSLNQQAG